MPDERKIVDFMVMVLQRTGLFLGCFIIVAAFSVEILAQFDTSRTGRQVTENIDSKISGKTSVPSENNAVQTASFTEGFDSGAIPTGWSIQNLSQSIGTNPQCWNLLTTTPWVPQAGSGHIGANLDCTGGVGTISGWLFSPVIAFRNGDQIKFWTRKISPDIFADRLELRLSLAGTSTNAGTTATSVGDFTTVLLTVNPTLVTGVYPTTYTQYTATISGLTTPTEGRVAFRYFVTNGGPYGFASDTISIDSFNYAAAAPTAAATVAGGRVTETKGRGIFRALVVMTDLLGNQRSAYTNQQGYYKFADVASGQVYVFTATHRRYLINQPTQVQFIGEENDSINFIGSAYGIVSTDVWNLPARKIE